jgi:ribosomal protein S18 acetylase RimI-like enzyme
MADQQAVLASVPIAARVTIRPAARDDLPRLEWGGAFWGLRNHFRQTFEGQLAGKNLMLIADLNGYPVGRLCLQFAARNPAYADGSTRGYLYSLHVMAPLRGFGIGSHLMQTGENVLADRGFTWATIAAAKNNPQALRLYKRRGYRPFREDSGRWSYVDPDGVEHTVNEPCWVLKKRIGEAPDDAPSGR